MPKNHLGARIIIIIKIKNNNNAYNNEQPLKTPRDYLLSAIMTLIRAKKNEGAQNKKLKNKMIKLRDEIIIIGRK